jgi:hypothetical protein
VWVEQGCAGPAAVPVLAVPSDAGCGVGDPALVLAALVLTGRVGAAGGERLAVGVQRHVRLGVGARAELRAALLGERDRALGAGVERPGLVRRESLLHA